MANSDRALEPEDITRIFVERANARDAAGAAALYAEDAALAFPPGQITVGRDAIRELYETLFANTPRFEQEAPLATLRSGDLALTSTPPKDGGGVRVQVVQRQPDGSWLRILDYPELGRVTEK